MRFSQNPKLLQNVFAKITTKNVLFFHKKKSGFMKKYFCRNFESCGTPAFAGGRDHDKPQQPHRDNSSQQVREAAKSSFFKGSAIKLPHPSSSFLGIGTSPWKKKFF